MIFGVLSIITFIIILFLFYEAELMYVLAGLVLLLFNAIAVIQLVIGVVISYFLARLYLFIWAETIKLIIISKNKIGQSIDRLLSKKEKKIIFLLTISICYNWSALVRISSL